MPPLRFYVCFFLIFVLSVRLAGTGCTG